MPYYLHIVKSTITWVWQIT